MMNGALKLSCEPSLFSSTNKSEVRSIDQIPPIYEGKWEGVLDNEYNTGYAKQVSNMICVESVHSTNRMRHIPDETKAYYTISSFASHLLQEQEFLSVELESTFKKRFWDILA